MEYNLRKSGVLTGCFNSFCLACDSLLKSGQEVNEHIATSLHKENLNAVPYLDKFIDDYIRKFKIGYFCEFCNVLLPIAAKVKLHITEDEHKQNKGILLLKPMGRDVVAFNNILIEENAWHGLMDEICSLCNIEFDDEEEHKSDTNHSLNLALKPIKFGAAGAIFREIDESSIQCLTCNKLLAPNLMTKHINEADHQEIYSKRLINKKNVCEPVGNIETDVEIETSEKVIEPTINNDGKDDKTIDDHKSKILESLPKYQSKGININLETETAFCKKCSKVITFEFTKIEDHIENHPSDKNIDSDLLYPTNLDPNLNRIDIKDKSTNTSQNLKDKNVAEGETKMLPDIANSEPNSAANNSTDEEGDEEGNSTSSGNPEKCNGKYDPEAKDYATEHQITYNAGIGEAYCRICKVKLPSPLRSMKEHVAGATHKKLTKHEDVAGKSSQNKSPASVDGVQKIKTKIFVESIHTIKSLYGVDSVINEKYCIPALSFWLISEINSRRRCLLCDMYLMPNSEPRSHVATRRHSSQLELMPVVTSESSEFIREIRLGVYHCGFCNLLVSSWAEMKQHLKCAEHKEKKRWADFKLELHLPIIQQIQEQRNMEVMKMLWLLNCLGR